MLDGMEVSSRTLRTRAFVLAVLACTWSCGDPAPYKIGLVLDEDGLRAATLAADAVNASGGINGRRLVLRAMGGAGSTAARIALAAAESLATDATVLAVVGHTNSSASLAASQVYNARHVVQLAPNSSTPMYSSAGPYSFRLVASDIHQGVFLADQALALAPRARIAVVFVNDDYGRALRKVLVERLRSAGVVPVLDVPYVEDPGQFDPDEIVSGLARAHPDLLLWVGRSTQFVLAVHALKRVLPTLTVLGSDGFGGPTVGRDSLHMLDGVRYVRMVDLQHASAELVRLREQYRREGRGEASDQAVLSYDAISLLAEAIRRAGPRRDAIREWLAQVGRAQPPYQGLSGPIAFPTGGDRQPRYVVEQIGKDRLAAAASVERAGAVPARK